MELYFPILDLSILRYIKFFREYVLESGHDMFHLMEIVVIASL